MRLPNSKYAKRKCRQSGSGLLLTLGAMALLVGTMGAAIDFSHIYMVQSEVEALADEAALQGARELDGTHQGLTRARRVIRGIWEDSPQADWLTFSTDKLEGVQAEFATSQDGPWQESPQSAAKVRFVRLTATANARLFFLPMWPGLSSSLEVRAGSVAGQGSVNDANAELLVDPPPSEFKAGQSYPVRTTGGGDCHRALAQRFLQDTDTAATEFQSYVETGNGRRVMIAQVETSPPAYVTMFLQRESGETCAATYAGDAPVLGARINGAGRAGLYEVRLFP